jgi:hypothetical protein
MNVEHYTPIQLHKKSFQFSQFLSAHFEPLLLSLVILTGIIGSIYLFGANLVSEVSSSPNGNNTPNSSMVALLLGSSDDTYSTNEFDKYVKIKGDIKAGKNFDFGFIGDEKASRFIMEMGDGVRLIVTQKNLMYNYAEPGKYTIELKELKAGLLTLIGTKKIKVK